jgi:FKBP-type peptidyl-prolyl cis-trans isomerase FkpA
MRPIKGILLLVTISIVLISCEADFEQLASGYEIKRIESKGGKQPADKDAIRVHMSIALDDSVFFDTREVFPVGRKLAMNNMWPAFKEVLQTIGNGDSVQIRMGLPEYAKLEGRTLALRDSTLMVTMSMRVLDVADEAAVIEKMMRDQFDYEQEQIQEYLVNNNLEAEYIDEEVYYIVSQEGTGDFITLSDSVIAQVTLRTLEGVVLGTNKEDVAIANGLHVEGREYEPLRFTVEGESVEGWMRYIPRFRQGGAGTLIIPSRYGYGSRGAGNMIPPNTTLVYDIEILELR